MAKRAYGTGTLRQQGGAWYGRWTSPAGHKRNRKLGPQRAPGTRDGLTKAQAEKVLRELMQADAATPAVVHATFAEAAAALLVKQAAAGNKRSSMETVESILRVPLVPYFDAKDLARVRPPTAATTRRSPPHGSAGSARAAHAESAPPGLGPTPTAWIRPSGRPPR
jgi:hypothetical protein